MSLSLESLMSIELSKPGGAWTVPTRVETLETAARLRTTEGDVV